MRAFVARWKEARVERRTFLTGAFGLAAMALGAGIALPGIGKASRLLFVTTEGVGPDASVGPLMQAGIEVSEMQADQKLVGSYEDTQLFVVDRSGAALIELADGTRTIEELAEDAGESLGQELDPADVAKFFVTLGQAGYLQDLVLVNLVEQRA